MSGIPIATWPMYAEQRLNAFQMVRELGLAAEIRLDYQWNNIWGEVQAIVTAEEIEVGIRKVMDRDSKVKEMKDKCNMTTKEGGSLAQLINDIMNSEAVHEMKFSGQEKAIVKLRPSGLSNPDRLKRSGLVQSSL
ncbi:hypothetical protein LguiA_014564 [Lonicera macranthoides]